MCVCVCVNSTSKTIANQLEHVPDNLTRTSGKQLRIVATSINASSTMRHTFHYKLLHVCEAVTLQCDIECLNKAKDLAQLEHVATSIVNAHADPILKSKRKTFSETHT